MLVVQESRQLFAQGFVALGVMPGYDRTLEQQLLYLLRQIAPRTDNSPAQGNGKPLRIHCIALPFHIALPSVELRSMAGSEVWRNKHDVTNLFPDTRGFGERQSGSTCEVISPEQKTRSPWAGIIHC